MATAKKRWQDPARAEYQRLWDKDNTVRKAVKFNRNTDEDIVARIQSLTQNGENFSEYVKRLIREDIERENLC